MIVKTPGSIDREYDAVAQLLSGPKRHRIFLFSGMKFAFDRGVALLTMPPILLICAVLLILNPFLNPGRLFYAQIRMGKHGKPFVMFKFRSMTEAPQRSRGHDEGLETTRITRLGHLLRKHRIDELPNMFNVLKGEMSIIGPRPDAWSHARHYSRTIPGYARRFGVRPGITGLAQVVSGYADGQEATQVKADLDRRYIENYGFRQEAMIFLRTFRVILTGHGAR